jgi:hypothetical protein
MKGRESMKRMQALEAAIIDHLRQGGGGSQRAIAADGVRRRRQDVAAALERLYKAGQVDQATGRKRSQLWCLR